MMDRLGCVTAILHVDVDTIVDCDYETLMEFFSERLIGYNLMSSHQYDVIAAGTGNSLVIKVSAIPDSEYFDITS